MPMIHNYKNVLSPNYISLIDKLVQCTDHFKWWMSHYFLQLNKDKAKFLVIRAKVQREILCTKLNSLATINLGVLLDPDLNFESQ